MSAPEGDRPPSERPGLQGERTELAWERSAVGLLAAAGLLLSRHVGPLAWGRITLVAADVALALLVIWLGRRRGRQIRALRTGPDGRSTAQGAGREVVLVGAAAVAIAVGTAVVIVFPT
jgi:uncharacterized membrane protein YidH (DUF202 family)